jgi:hypothetical protein
MAERPRWSSNLAAFCTGFAQFAAGVVVPQLAVLPDLSGFGLGLTFTQAGLLLIPGALAIVETAPSRRSPE